jgi:hypothetical protein
MKQDRQRSRQFASGRIRRGGLANGAQSLPDGRFAGFGSQLIHTLQAPLDLSVEVSLVIVVIRKCGVNLAQREVGMLEMDLFCAPAVRNLIERNLDYFRCRIVDPGDTAVIEADMSLGYCGHNQMTKCIEAMRLVQP